MSCNIPEIIRHVVIVSFTHALELKIKQWHYKPEEADWKIMSKVERILVLADAPGKFQEMRRKALPS